MHTFPVSTLFFTSTTLVSLILHAPLPDHSYLIVQTMRHPQDETRNLSSSTKASFIGRVVVAHLQLPTIYATNKMSAKTRYCKSQITPPSITTKQKGAIPALDTSAVRTKVVGILVTVHPTIHSKLHYVQLHLVSWRDNSKTESNTQPGTSLD